MHGISRQMKGSVFKYYNCHFKGRPRPEPWRSWRDLILQRVPAVVTSPNGASPQSKHCNPPIPSHSRISQLVPPEYGGNLGRGKIGTQTGVIFAAPSARSHSPRPDSESLAAAYRHSPRPSSLAIATARCHSPRFASLAITRRGPSGPSRWH